MRSLADRVAALAAPTLAELRAAAHTASKTLPGLLPQASDPYRLAIVADNGGALRHALAAFAQGTDHPGVESAVMDQPLRLAMLFTGQGSQYPGMGLELYRKVSSFRSALDRCADSLRGQLPLLNILFGGHDAETLRQTKVTQPALFAIEYAATQMWATWGIRPHAVLGHSIGEYVAACVAGCFNLNDALRLVCTRGRLMQSLPSGGAMVSVFGPPDTVRAVLSTAGLARVAIAAVNGPSSLVLSGPAQDVGEATNRLTASGLMTRQMPVSHAFHSCLMEPILEQFERAAREIRFRPPRVHLVSNLTGRPLAASQRPDARYWRRHLREPVLFEAGVRSLSETGCQVSLEVGPKPTLVGMGRKCLSAQAMTWVSTMWPGHDQITHLLRTAASLYVHGGPVDWQRMAADLADVPEARDSAAASAAPMPRT